MPSIARACFLSIFSLLSSSFRILSKNSHFISAASSTPGLTRFSKSSTSSAISASFSFAVLEFLGLETLASSSHRAFVCSLFSGKGGTFCFARSATSFL